MCNLPLYKVKGSYNNRTILPLTAHAGLWYDKFFNQFDGSWKVLDAKGGSKGGKVNWINSVKGTVGNDTMIKNHAARTNTLVLALGGCVRKFQTQWNFVTGLGLSHPVDNGFAWHRTLGVPYLTGAAVKGMLRAWVDVWDDPDKKEERLKTWFGDTDSAGELIFFDAVPIGPVGLIRDVMTPHMGGWYKDGGEGPKQDGSNVPADWHDPVPVPFLAVKPGVKFQFAFARRPGKGQDIVLTEVAKALEDALGYIGAGAKTAAGYGRFGSEQNVGTAKEVKTEVWESAVLTYKPNIPAISANGKAETRLQDIPPPVPEVIMARLKKKKRASAKVTVEVTGNKRTIAMVEE
jgi:CRISPR-associated protein Cmr6